MRLALGLILAVQYFAASHVVDAATPPNIIIVVADDLGWRDTGYSGNEVVKTPALDEIARTSVRFDYFYPAQQMCSPGRYAIMTGRTPIRTGLHHLGAMRESEITIPKALKTAGYSTAHFGKWHLGSTNTSPVKMGFDQAHWRINFFDLGASLQVGDTKETVPLVGDTSVATMKLAVDYVRAEAAAKRPFFMQVCFGSPHAPHQAAEEYRALYKDLPEKQQQFYGEISGVDAAVGNLRAALRELEIERDTMLWFVSDNGGITPASQDPAGKGKMNVGVRTTGLLEWPGGIPKPIQTTVPAAHMDLYPTILELVGIKMPNQPPLDGVSLLPLFRGEMKAREKPLGFMLWNGSGNFDKVDLLAETQAVWIDGPLKLIVEPNRNDTPAKQDSPKEPNTKKAKQKNMVASGAPVKLFDIYADPEHKNNLAESRPDDVKRMRAALEAWQKSVRASYDGADFVKK